METAIYVIIATTLTIRIKDTRCMKITTHDYIVLLTIVPIVVRLHKHNLHNKQDVILHCRISMWELTDAWTQNQNCKYCTFHHVRHLYDGEFIIIIKMCTG